MGNLTSISILSAKRKRLHVFPALFVGFEFYQMDIMRKYGSCYFGFSFRHLVDAASVFFFSSLFLMENSYLVLQAVHAVWI